MRTIVAAGVLFFCTACGGSEFESGGSGGSGGSAGSGGAAGAPDSGLGGGSGGLGATGGGGGTGGEGAACPETSRCVPMAPNGWTGPVSLGDDCTGTSLQVFQGVNALPASCDCTCDPTSTCGQTMGAGAFNLNACSDSAGGESLFPGQCFAKSYASHSVKVGLPTVTCTSELTTTKLPVDWSTKRRLCESTSSGASCDGDGNVCIVKNGSAPICVHKAGDATCPIEYPNKETFYTTADDTRACSGACSCTGSGGECQTVVTYFSTGDCNPSSTVGSKPVSSSQEKCVLDGTVIGMKATAPTVLTPGTCASSGTPTPIGEVTPTDPITVCCLD